MDAETKEEKLIPDSAIVENTDGTVSVELDDSDGGAPPAPSPAPAPSETADDPNLRRGGGEEDDTEGDEAHRAELAGARTEEEREAIRARRRQERQDRKQRRRERDETFRMELAARDQIIDEMRRKLNTIERRNTGSEVAQIDARIRHEEGNVAYLKTVIADATKVGNGEAVAEATVKVAESLRNVEELARIRQQMARAASAPQAPQLDPRMVANAAAWMESAAWYNPAGTDVDSREVLIIDQRLAEEGYDPTRPAYWQELDRRVRERLPHRYGRGGGAPAPSAPDNPGYNGDASQRRPSRSVVTGSGNTGGVAPGNAPRTSFVLSPERVQALKDAGLWNDPKLRTEAIRRYQRYDADNASSSSR